MTNLDIDKSMSRITYFSLHEINGMIEQLIRREVDCGLYGDD